MKVAICDRASNVRWSDLWQGNPAVATPMDVTAGVPHHRIVNAPNARPYNANVPFTRESGVRFTDWKARDHRGRIYLTPQELAHGQRIAWEYGPYWVIEPSPQTQSSPNKRWHLDRFAEVVEAIPEVLWVQPLHRESKELDGAEGVPTSTFREACGLLAGAAGFLGTEGGLHHAAAALGIPSVVIWGGCMSVEHLGYPEQTNLVDTGPGSPCGKWVPCEHCHDAMDRITVSEVVKAVSARIVAA